MQEATLIETSSSNYLSLKAQLPGSWQANNLNPQQSGLKLCVRSQGPQNKEQVAP